MRYFFIASMICIPFLQWSQGLKIGRKYRGVFIGTQAAYTVMNHSEKFKVDTVSIVIKIYKTGVDICYLNGSQCIIENSPVILIAKNEKNKKESILKIKSQQAMILEELIFNKRNKSITRLGIYPQPNLVALRTGKKQ